MTRDVLPAARAQLAEAEAELLLLQAALELQHAQRAGSQRGAGGREDFMKGFVFGLLLGLPAMLCLMEPAASGRLRVGILSGFFAQLFLASSRLSARGEVDQATADAQWLDG